MLLCFALFSPPAKRLGGGQGVGLSIAQTAFFFICSTLSSFAMSHREYLASYSAFPPVPPPQQSDWGGENLWGGKEEEWSSCFFFSLSFCPSHWLGQICLPNSSFSFRKSRRRSEAAHTQYLNIGYAQSPSPFLR